MKYYFLAAFSSIGFAVTGLTLYGQNNLSVQAIFDHYYALRNAITNSKPTDAIKAAVAFTTTVQSVNAKQMSAKELVAFQSVQPKLLSLSQELAKTPDLTKQRNLFQGLSNDVIALRKEVKLPSPSYVAFCPMKKAYWLTQEKEVKNPYYGSSMLNCGSISQTIQ
ncbi:MAG TPA: DUF3347 domain-containing protein [Chitinophagaceae bacterium]|nr:DUF3347 domain-containing protein [Chitinophagaceae bacterium]